MRPNVVAVAGGGNVDPAIEATAEALGKAIAERGWVLVNGGRDVGVMAAATRGAAEAGGLVVGILPGPEADPGAAPGLTVALPTGLGDGRNALVARAGEVLVALPGGPGTLSEVALALKAGRPVILLGWEEAAAVEGLEGERVRRASSVEEALSTLEALLSARL